MVLLQNVSNDNDDDIHDIFPSDGSAQIRNITIIYLNKGFLHFSSCVINTSIVDSGYCEHHAWQGPNKMLCPEHALPRIRFIQAFFKHVGDFTYTKVNIEIKVCPEVINVNGEII